MDQYDNTPNIRLMPPVFLMKSQLQCYMCCKQTDVFCLGSNGFIEEDVEVTEFAHYSNIAWVPSKLERIIKKYARGYYFDYIKQRGNCYFINHCQCRTKLSEFQVHNEPETGFFPVNAEQAARITLFTITDNESYDVCATSILHDDTLITANATYDVL